jgi:hypothetical protein
MKTRPCPVDPERFVHVLVPSKFSDGMVWKVVKQAERKS